MAKGGGFTTTMTYWCIGDLWGVSSVSTHALSGY